jgi:formylglycine-generating enzyme required for sulfatase activity
MDPSFEPLLRRLDHLSEQFRELRDGVQKAVLVADVDPEMALTRARKVLEYVVRDVYERRCHEPPGTRPLENLLQRLVKDGHFPDRLDAYASAIRKLGNVGTHAFGEKVTAADVYQSLTQLMPILEWYFENECPEAAGRQPPQPAHGRPSLPLTERRVPVVPKGLRSFDAKDADFFLDLLPGPRDRDGLPETVRFWKHRVEERDEPTFTVGVLYGPSGCGKSSLVKAGLLPRLAGHVLPVYVEATAADTEARVLRGLRKVSADLPGDLDLTRTLAALRQGKGLRPVQKVFLVLDQFEQWLHARRGEENPELAHALRQCDGEHVQCVVLVRDDFWLAVSRFMQDLQIELLQGQNLALVDLFDLPHARGVLAAFGRAFGRLPEALTKEQESFVSQAVDGLSQEGRVIPVRLALFAEMVKGKPWTPVTLREVGGTEGTGVAFLEETFGSPLASPRHRLHQQAARSVLKALLPETGTDIKGNMQSHNDLLLASGYARRPGDFEELLRILDAEVRLITPTEPAGTDAAADPAEQYYQLTHDYLVPLLRDWLTRKQKETRRGRAELRLAERAASWAAKLESRHLPAWWEWASIRLLTRRRDWTAPQRKMMERAAWFHGVRGMVLVACLTLLAWGSWTGFGTLQAHALRDRLLNATTEDVPAIIKDMARYRRWTDPLLEDTYHQAEANHDARTQLHASLALLPADPGQVAYLYRRLLDARPEEVGVIGQALSDSGHGPELTERLWKVVEQPRQGHEGQRLRAACALAGYAPEDARWEQASGPVVEQLVGVDLVFLKYWTDALRPVRGKLLGPLRAVFRSPKEERATQRGVAASVLADYATDRADVVADLIQDADERQFAVLYPKLFSHRERAAEVLRQAVADSTESQGADEEKERAAKRQANAAVVLLRLGQAGAVWPLLRHPSHPEPRAFGFSDPRVRSYLIHRLGPLGADPADVVRRLGEEKEVSARRALLLALGEFGPDRLPPAGRKRLIPRVLRLYRDDPDAGLHGAAEWLLRQWGQAGTLRQTDEGSKGERRQREEQIRRELASRQGEGQGYWYVNGQGQTMVVIPGPAEFLMGSPPTEEGRGGRLEGTEEGQHRERIGRSYAMASKEVTVEQFLRFRKGHDYNKASSPTADCPVNNVTWHDAAAYCNWLSEREGIPKEQWCYLPDGGKPAGRMRAKPNYLSLVGYRLPSEAEWEYACRAGAVTSRYYGETKELLVRYAWYTKNSLDRWMVPGGTLKPNDFGLFDMLGNALEWCQDPATPAPSGPGGRRGGDRRDDLGHALRGGSFYFLGAGVRSAMRFRLVPTGRTLHVGFRLARTFR